MNTLKRTLNKIQHCEGRRWCGYLTPVEVIALANDGMQMERRDIDTAQRYKKRGKSNPRWVYFNIPKGKKNG